MVFVNEANESQRDGVSRVAGRRMTGKASSPELPVGTAARGRPRAFEVSCPVYRKPVPGSVEHRSSMNRKPFTNFTESP